MVREREIVQYKRLKALDNLEFLHASYLSHKFSKHSHETFSIGLIERGVNQFFCRGRMEAATAGTICVMNPGEVHTGEPGDGGLVYWNFYPSAELLTGIAEDVSDRHIGGIDLDHSVIEDVVAAGLLRQMFQSLAHPASLLERESRLVEALTWLVRHHAHLNAPRPPKLVPHAIRRSIDFLHTYSDQNILLADLAELAGMSRFHFLRAFQLATGMPPHAYLTQRRLANAKSMMAAGQTIADVAIATGFSDQAHFTRMFKRAHGISPGRWITASQ